MWPTSAEAAPLILSAVLDAPVQQRLDALRRAGWRGTGPVPWTHRPNQGFLRSLHALALAAAAIHEDAEAERCAKFLDDCDPAAAQALA